MDDARAQRTPDDPNNRSERLALLAELDGWLEAPMQVLGFVWLALLVVEFTRGLSPALTAASTVIWVLFIVDFGIRLALAPERGQYLRHNWLTALSLVVPALRVLRIARTVRVLGAARAMRSLRLVKVVGSVNRTMTALRRSMGRRGFGYVVVLTALITLAGSAGMYGFEHGAPGGGIASFGSAVWWTAMLMTTMGSAYWPVTTEGRVLCVLLALYAFAIFGYVTASLATFFVGRDAEATDGEIAGASAIEALRAQVAALTVEVRALRESRVG